MKVAQDTPATAVVCLAFGLLIAKVSLPERHYLDADKAAPSEPAMQAILVGRSEGRSLERLPTSSEDDAEAFTSDDTRGAKTRSESATKLLASTELRQLAATSLQAPAGCLSDWMVVLVLTASAIIGVLCLAFDHKEMIEASRDEAACPHSTLKSCDQFGQDAQSSISSLQALSRLLAIVASLVVATVTLALMMPCLQSHLNVDKLPESVNGNELRLLAQVANNSLNLRPSLLPDSLIVILLGIVMAIGAACLRFDHQEMVKASDILESDTSSSSLDNVLASSGEPAAALAPGRHFKANLAFVASLATLLCCVMTWWAEGPLTSGGATAQANVDELTNLSHNARRSLSLQEAFLPDNLLLLLLAGFGALGAIFMHVDYADIKEQMSRSPATPVIDSIDMTSPQVEAPHCKKLGLHLRMPALAVRTTFAILAVGVVALLCYQGDTSGLEEGLIDKQFNELAQLVCSLPEVRHALLPDDLLVFLLEAFLLLGAVCMGIDRTDMKRQFDKASGSEDCVKMAKQLN